MNPVRASIRHVIANSSHVSTDESKVFELAPEIAKEDLELPKWDAPFYPKENDRGIIDFFMLMNTINFAFTEFEEPHRKFEARQQGMDFNWTGAFAMQYCLARAMPRITDAKYLANLTPEEAKEVFRGDTIEIPMLRERVEILNEIGTVLDEKYKGHFHSLVEESNMHAFKDGRGIVEKLVADFPSFNDAAIYKGKEVRLHKRAQLAVGMLYARLNGTGLFDVKDIDELTVYADYALPVGLTSMGIMAKDAELEEKIQNWVEIGKGSEEEVEIRAHTIYGADLLVREINRHRAEGRKVNALQIDYRIWSETRKPALKKGYKHQLVRTTAY